MAAIDGQTMKTRRDSPDPIVVMAIFVWANSDPDTAPKISSSSATVTVPPTVENGSK
jgi:hypothetical protein